MTTASSSENPPDVASSTDSVAPDRPTDEQASIPTNDRTRPSMAVKIYAPFKVYFEGDAYSVSAENATGPFDILPRHHNFLCMLVPCEVKVVASDGTTKSIKIHRALMHVKADKVVVFMDV